MGWSKPTIWEGDTAQKLSIDRDIPWLAKDTQQRKDIERFRWFSNGYIALDKQNPNHVADIRYSLLPQQIKPLWGIDLSPTANSDQYVKFTNERGDGGSAFKQLWQMLMK